MLETRRRPKEEKNPMLYRSPLSRSMVPLLTLFLGAAALRADTNTLTFPSEVAVVNVHATVTQDGSPARDGLSAGDFRISENDKPQEVAFFAHEEVPVTYTLLVDISGSMRGRARLVFEALETFITTMRPGDRASIVLFGTTAKVIQEETGDPQTLLAATDRIPEDFNDGTALYEVLYGHFWEVQARGCSADTGPRRCALVVFSDGKDETSRRAFRSEVLDAARRADLAVYPVAMTRHNAFLERLARETGGRVSYVDHGGELADAYRAISAEVASQYTIGYLPSSLPAPGAWHPVRVTVAKKGVTVRHRAGYFTTARRAQRRSETTDPKTGR
jgi:Ca-activated chloride channel family protein